jgi:hemoglobin
MPLEKAHFDRWVELFHAKVDSLFTGEKAEMAKQRATLIGWTIQNKTGVK